MVSVDVQFDVRWDRADGEDCWWAEAKALPGYTVAASSREDLEALAIEGAGFFLEDEDDELGSVTFLFDVALRVETELADANNVPPSAQAAKELEALIGAGLAHRGFDSALVTIDPLGRLDVTVSVTTSDLDYRPGARRVMQAVEDAGVVRGYAHDPFASEPRKGDVFAAEPKVEAHALIPA